MASSSVSAKTEDSKMTEDARVGERDPDYVQREKNIRAALNIFKKMDRDEGYISYILLQKLFGQDRKCSFCGVKGPGKVPNTEECLELYVGECGVIARQDIQCLTCGKVDILITCDDLEELPTDIRLRIKGSEACNYYKTISHFEILHDLMKMLRVAALDDRQKRREGYADLADFILHNARRVCEEWCKPEYAELRLKKYLRLREETLLTTYQPYFTPDVSEEYKEMYGMMADSFRENRGKVLQLLSLMKESLIDRPTRSGFMMWVSVSMIHAEAYQAFSTMYDPCAFMRGDYQSLQERYMALNVPIGIKKIPVVFMLFELPRFYYYIDFLYRKVGRGTRSYLTSKDRAALAALGEDVTIKDETLNVPVTSVSYEPTPDPDQDYVPMIPELDSDGDLPGESKQTATSEPTKLAVMTTAPTPLSAGPQPVVMTTDQFRSMLVDHLKANEASVASETHQPTYHRYIGGKLVPPLPLSTRNALLSSARTGPKPGRSSRARKEARKARQLGVAEPDRKTVLVCQVDTDALRARGFHVGEGSRKTTIIASKDGNLEHILEGVETPEQVKSFLSVKYNILSQQQGTGYITVPNSDESLDLSHASPAPGVQRYDTTNQRNQKGTRNAKKKKRYMKPIAAPPASTTATSSTTPKQEPDDGLSGFPFTANWTKERRATFKQEILKGLGDVPTRVTPPVQSMPVASSSSEKPKSKKAEEEEALSLSHALAKVLAPLDPLESIRKEIRGKCDERNIPMPDLEVTHAPLQFTKSPPGCKEPVTVTLTTRVKLRPSSEDSSKIKLPPEIIEFSEASATFGSDPTYDEAEMEKSEIMEQVKADLERKIRQQNRRKMEEWGREKSTRKSCPEVERKDLESPAASAASSSAVESSAAVILVVQTPTDPVPVIQTPTDPAPVVQTPADPAPVVQTPTDPAPVVQTPTDPAPVVQTPTDPAPVVQTPTDPVPVVRTPTDPIPVVQTPTDPVPVVQTPTGPVPASPVVQMPTGPAPVVQTPTDPAPASLLSRDPCDVIQPGNTHSIMEKAPVMDEVKSKKTARDRFKCCENCRMEISDRILLCAGCKKVAYCNYRCQKAHWKIHKKTCSYALKKDSKDRTG